MRNSGRLRVVDGAAAALVVLVLAGPGTRVAATPAAVAKPEAKPAADVIVPVVRSEAEWKRLLAPEQFRILRQAGTEIAFTGRYWNNHAKGTYVCAACGLPLFSSATKYESGTGWPSFWRPIAANHVVTALDASFGEERTEVKCARCGGHLGHVFDDGPPPTGLRYCMNSAALKFIPSR